MIFYIIYYINFSGQPAFILKGLRLMELVKAVNYIRLGKDFKLHFGDNLLTLDQGFMSVGGKLPSTHDLVTPQMEVIKLPKGVRKTIFTVPSLDTPVCESQIKMLSESLNKEDISERKYYVISIDTPFAQAKFIKDNNINQNIQFISDYANHRFMIETGLRIIELNLFARSVIECDENDMVLSVTIPVDITQVP